MNISGVEIDFQDMMSRARTSMLKEVGIKPWKYGAGSQVGQVNLALRGLVWHEIAEFLKCSIGSRDGTIRAEEAMAEAMRRGLTTGNIRFRKKAFIAQLANSRYRVRKRDVGYAAGPEAVGGFFTEEMGWCSPSMFAELMFTFDTLIPLIDSQAAPMQEVLIEAQKRMECEKMAEQVQRTALKALVDRYLSPLGIRCNTTMVGGKVALHLELLKRGSIVASLDELPALLEDTEAVIKALKPVTERKYNFLGQEL